MKTLATIAFAGLAFAPWCQAQLDDVEFATWDTDSDGHLSVEEWESGFNDNDLFERLDEDGNMLISGEELNDAGNLRFDVTWDQDVDGVIDQNEAILGLYRTYDWDLDDQMEAVDLQIFKGDIGLEVDEVA